MSLNWNEEDLESYYKRRNMDNCSQIATKAVQTADDTKQSKYRNKKTEIDGIIFDSKKEADYYQRLKIMKHIGEIQDFDRQVAFELQPEFEKDGQKIRAIRYIADFVIYKKDNSVEIVDTKGIRTKDFELKRKMFEYKYQQYKLKIV